MYDCQILADSAYADPQGSDHKYRLTTFQITVPRFILAEINTHRMLSKNSASSRAIPVKKSIEAVRDDPFVPEKLGMNQPGMQAGEQLLGTDLLKAYDAWEDSMFQALKSARQLDALDVHKGHANRLLEPFKWHTMIITGTDWENFFALRNDPSAQPEFERIAKTMERAYRKNKPYQTDNDQIYWHLPLVSWKEVASSSANYGFQSWKMISVGRCARVSYLTHDGKRDLEADIKLAQRLEKSGHLSPFEHVARPFTTEEWSVLRTLQDNISYHRSYAGMDTNQADYLTRLVEYRGNLRGWASVRTEVTDEHDYSLVKGK